MSKQVRTVLVLFIVVNIMSSIQLSRAAGIPRPEHPRPDFWREQWLTLNGTWAFQFDPGNIGIAEQWFAPESQAIAGQIVVPFPWQSDLSGVHDTFYRGVAWYRRTIDVPPDWGGQRVFLRFGAADYFSTVWVNGQQAGEHEGGYTPFEFDITPLLRDQANILTVRVEDPADLSEIPHGKQRSDPPNPWDDVSFTTTSGIWQTVWLEPRPALHITGARITPDVAGKHAVFYVTAAAASTAQLDVSITAPDGQKIEQRVEISGDAQFAVPIAEPVLWDIRQPNLYTVTLKLTQPDQASADDVNVYFGMRSIERRGNQVYLNGRPIYFMSALDQGYWPDGNFTPPTDDALRWDVDYALKVGFNGLRKHIKIEDPRFYYWADKLGLLMWCDAPSPVRFTELARQRLQRDLKGMIERDYNHPSIVVWSPYNESWGLEFRSHKEIQDWLVVLYDRIKTWDPTRLVVDNSGWRHVRTDIADSHKYTEDKVEWRGYLTLLANDPMTVEVLGHPFYAGRYKYAGEPLMVSEYGVGWGGMRPFHFKWQTDEIRRHAAIVGYTYTELYDIEHELAGLATYDRRPKYIDLDFSMLNNPDFIGPDFRGEHRIQPGQSVEVPIFVSLYGTPTFSRGDMRWRLETVPQQNQQAEVFFTGSAPVDVASFTVTRLAPVAFVTPDTNGKVRLWFEVWDSTLNRRAQNFLEFDVVAAP